MTVLTVAARRALLAPQAAGVTPVLVAVNAGVFGNKTTTAAGFGQVDLAAAYRAAGSTIPAGTQTWDVQIISGTNASTALGYNDASSLTASGYSGTGNTGRTPYRKNTLTGAYVLQYRVRINGGAWSNWADYTFTAEADSVNCGNNYSSDNFPFGILGVADGATAYTNGVRKMRLMVGLSRPDFRMGSNFNFASGTGYSRSDMLKVMWSNNQLAPTLSAISFGSSSSGIWVDLEYDGVTVTGGRLRGANANTAGKVSLAGVTDCLVTRVNAMNTEADYLVEYDPSANGGNGNNWGGIVVTGTNNRIGIIGDDNYANYISHVFYGIYVSESTLCEIGNNIVWLCHGRHIASSNTSQSVHRQENIMGPSYRSSNDITGLHLDKDWSEDGTLGGVVQQDPWLIREIMTSTPEQIMSARLGVIGATPGTTTIATPQMRYCIVSDSYIYPIELSDWTGRARFCYNDGSMLPLGDYSRPDSGGYDVGSAGSRAIIQPDNPIGGGGTLECTGNVLYRDIALNANSTAVLEVGGTNIEGLRGVNAAWLAGYVNGNPATYIAANLPLGTGRMPVTAAEILTWRQTYWTAFRRNDGYGPVNASGTGWVTIAP